jgi:hypothetical protein
MHNNVIFPLLIVLTVLGSSLCIIFFIINSVINCESFQVITLEVTTLDFVSKNISDINLSDNSIINS